VGDLYSRVGQVEQNTQWLVKVKITKFLNLSLNC
jgi:hypothetical protein